MLIQKIWELFLYIANVNSNGFKKSTANFEDLYSIHNSSDPDKFSGMGVISGDPRQQMSQGSFESTGGSLRSSCFWTRFFYSSSRRSS